MTDKVNNSSIKLAADKRIYVVGDSTVCDYGSNPDNYYLQRFGYGTQLFNYLDLSSPAQVVNLALSGRSSLSFLKERNYIKLKNSIAAGDYLIIGFGHNDEKSEDKERFTDPNADYLTPLTDKAPSFAYTLYENYIKLARDKGATPILCTPIVRYAEDGIYAGRRASHVTTDGDYAATILKLGSDTGTAVVDLTKITEEYYRSHNAEAQYFHAFITYKGAGKEPDGRDNTHLNKYGAKQIAYWFATNLPADCTLRSHVLAGVPDPEMKADFADAINREYEKTDYKGFNPAVHNPLATVSGTNWYKTAMGASGCKIDYGNGKFTVTAGSKFTDKSDGFGAVFVQIDESKNFKAAGKARVTCAPTTADSGIAFGMMLRDDIYIDKNDSAIASNFVSASVTCDGRANMSRTVKTSLGYGGRIAFAVNTEYCFSVVRTGQVVDAVVRQGASEVKTKFTDISFVGVDNTKMYLCLFASGGLTVEFTEVSFEITGESQGA